jgi:hypothetical protein
MGIGTLLGFLIGNRTAILTIAAHPRAWMVGLVFVFSAGFAREYDGEDLLHEPWHLALPLVASLLASFLLYGILYGFSTAWRKDGPTFLQGYRSFLGLFWMTAPLAWLYAIPYERFLGPLEATQANLTTLAIVAAWRVALMVRVAVVLMGMPFWTSLFRVMAYADGAALLAVCFLPFRILELMGGTRGMTEAEAAVRNAAGAVLCWGGATLPIWLIPALGGMLDENVAGAWQIPTQTGAAPQGVGLPLRIVAFLSVAAWIGILPFTQPEQKLRYEVELAFREKRIADALAVMAAHDLADFPPGWEPPPRYLKGEDKSVTLDVWAEILRKEPAPWVRDFYLEKLKAYVHVHYFHADTEKLADVLNRMPEGEGLALVSWMEQDPNIVYLYERIRPDLREALRLPKKADGD